MPNASLTIGSALLAFSLVLAAPRVAHADEPVPASEAPVVPASAAPVVVVVVAQPVPESPRPAPGPTSWYGYQPMAFDVVAGGMAVMSAKTENVPLAFGAVATYAFAAPLVHLVHGSGARFAGDLGMRLGGPLVGAVTGGGIGALGGDVYGAALGALGGLAVGATAAMIVDYAVLSKEPKREEPWDGKLHATPTVAATKDGASVGVGGAF